MRMAILLSEFEPSGPAMGCRWLRREVHMKSRQVAFRLVLALFLILPTLVAQVDQSATPRGSAVQNTAHPGGKDDLQAIGNRNIGKSGIGDWYSLDEEMLMGRRYAQAIEHSVTLLQDSIVTEYINRVGQNLVRNSDAKVPFTIKVIDSDEINAFALPGGFLYVNCGLIAAAQDEAELAGVMAHEIAHVAARHATRQMTRSEMFSLASIPLIFVGGGVGMVVRQATGLVGPLSMTKFSRSFEAEADYLGVEYVYKTGYDPQAYISFFERIQRRENQKPGVITKAFSSHPQTTDRIKKTQREIARILPARDIYVVSTSEFEDVKARLAAIENETRTGGQEPGLPTLRRRVAGNSEPKDDSRPTLRRRSD